MTERRRQVFDYESRFQPKMQRASRTGNNKASTPRRKRTAPPTHQPPKETYQSAKSGIRRICAFIASLAIPALLCVVALGIIEPMRRPDPSEDPSLSDIFRCTRYVPSQSRVSPLDDDATGMIAVMQRFPKGTSQGLMNLRNHFQALHSRARHIAGVTEGYLDKLDGTSVHSYAIKYSSSQEDMDRGIQGLYSNHTIAIVSMPKYADKLKSTIASRMDDYDDFSYAMADRWIPSLLVKSPLTRIKQDFRDFATSQLEGVHTLVLHTEHLVETLESTQKDLNNLSEKFEAEWKEWARMCTKAKETDYYSRKKFSVLWDKQLYCHSWPAEELRNMMQQSLEDFFVVTDMSLKQALESYTAIECQYRSTIAMLNEKSRSEAHHFVDNRSYRNSIGKIVEAIGAAYADTLELGDIPFVSELSQLERPMT